MNDATRVSRPRHAGPRRAVAVAALAGIALLAAACGGGGSSPAGSSAHRGQLTAQNIDAFAQCMRSHGLANFYFTRNGSGEGVQFGPWFAQVNPNSPPFPAAMKACSHILDLPTGPPPAPTAAQMRRLIQAAACIRAHGYPNWPDPTEQNGHLVRPAPPPGIDTNSPQFQAALKACQPAG
jgi:hypothetical protein